MKVSDEDIARRYVSLCSKCRAENIPFNLTFRDFKRLFRRTKCPYTGVIMQHRRLKQNETPPDNYPTIDKIVPSLGYTKGNVVLSSRRGNILKGCVDINTARNVIKFLESRGVQ